MPTPPLSIDMLAYSSRGYCRIWAQISSDMGGAPSLFGVTVEPCVVQHCKDPRVEGTHYCLAHAGYGVGLSKPVNPSGTDKKKIGFFGTAIVIVVAVVFLLALFGSDTGGSSSSDDDAWTKCQASVIANNTTNTIDYDGIDRCNRLYP